MERQHRAATASQVVVKIGHADQKLPNWKKFLAVSANKVALVDFLLLQWKLPEYAPHLFHRSLYMCHGNNCDLLTSTDGVEVQSWNVAALVCPHEEADTRLFLHAHHAAVNGACTVIVRSPDTDVAVLGCALARKIPTEVLMHTGTKQRSRYISLTAIAGQLGEDICAALPGLHAFSGCDTTSAFSGRGKKTALSLVVGGNRQAMEKLGESFDIDDELLSLCEGFTCAMYGRPGLSDVNELRYQLFRTTACQSSSLPPTRDALRYHVMRANYEAAVWRRSLTTEEPPSPHQRGWRVPEEPQQSGARSLPLTIIWMSQPPAPRALLELVSCGCSAGCSSNRCGCFKSNLPCTDVCRCKGCTNSSTKDTIELGDEANDND